MVVSATFNDARIEEYKTQQAESLGVNGWWRFEQRSKRWFNWAIYGPLVLAIIIFAVFDPNAVRIASGFAILSALAAVAAMIVTSKAKRPGVWKRYSVAEFDHAYPTWRTATNLGKTIEAVRAANPKAEFSVQALERADFVGPRGVILQRYVPISPPKEDDEDMQWETVLVITKNGHAIQEIRPE